jgi:hypothetical protein
MKNIEIAQILKVTDGVNASSVNLPNNVSLPESRYPEPDFWDSWVEAAHDYIAQSVEGGEFVAYRIACEGGEKVTLVMFSWSQGGFEGAALIDGWAESLAAAAMMWLGKTSADEHGDDHAIREILPIE